MSNDILTWIQGWYADQCNGDWEHLLGIKISTLDNPGWTISINLEETGLEAKTFPAMEIERSENDWIHAFIKEGSFFGACGPHNLDELLNAFRKWVEADVENE